MSTNKKHNKPHVETEVMETETVETEVVETESIEPEVNENFEKCTGTINVALVNSRQHPDKSADVTSFSPLKLGDTVEVLETVNGWCKYEIDGEVGYTMKEFITMDK